MNSLYIYTFILFHLLLHSSYGVTAYAVSDTDEYLYRIDLKTGEDIAIGYTDMHDAEGLAFDPVSGELYGVDDNLSNLCRLNLSNGFADVIGHFSLDGERFSIHAVGLTFTDDGTLYMTDEYSRSLYEVNTADASLTLMGSYGSSYDISALASFGGKLYGVDKKPYFLHLVTLNRTNGQVTVIGSTDVEVWGADYGLAFDCEGNLWLAQEYYDDDPGHYARLDTNTAAYLEMHLFEDADREFENLAIDTRPELRAELSIEFHVVDSTVATLSLSNASADFSYSVISKSSLSESEWTVLFEVPGRLDNGPVTTNITLTGPSGFFTVRGDYSTQ